MCGERLGILHVYSRPAGGRWDGKDAWRLVVGATVLRPCRKCDRGKLFTKVLGLTTPHAMMRYRELQRIVGGREPRFGI